MSPPSFHLPLSQHELETLESRLTELDPDASMAVDELDGFFAALACCPEPIPREEWLPRVLGETPRARTALSGDGEDAALLRLVERHRTAVATMLQEGRGFAPVLAYDERGVPCGNAWAIGFARGMSMRPDAWAPLDDDEDAADALEPVMRLVAEARQDDEGGEGDARQIGTDDPSEADEAWAPIADDEREAVIHEMLDGVQDVYEFFFEARRRALAPPEVRREGSKVGRNDRCPCGSGKKFKQCHGVGPLH